MTNSDLFTIAKTDDGTIQINFTIPYSDIKKEEDKVVESEIKNVQVPGFRKGMAPKEKALEKLPKEDLTQKTLSGILPNLLSQAINKEKLSLAIYPKFELIAAKENEPWQIRAISCEIPEVEIGNYKESIEGESKSNKIWTPDQKSDKEKELTKSEKETVVLKQILKTSKVKIPKLLIEEDVNGRLANLLDRIEHLGLNLEGYLASIGKTPESIREEYSKQSEESITLELALNKIADQEKIEVSKDKLDEAIKTSSTDPKLAEELKNPEKIKVLASVLRRQETISKLADLL